MAAICTGAAGAVLTIEASRLARNRRDWHILLEFCTLVNCLIIEEDGVYDPKLVNDWLLLDMKGTFIELELSILRQRSQGGHAALRPSFSGLAFAHCTLQGDRCSVAAGSAHAEAKRLASDWKSQ